jgi:4-hydroxy-3-methylbut-2-enyl diphosphate reductase
MQVSIDHTAGFCKGVVQSIRIAEEELQSGQPLYCLGEIIHNQQVVKSLCEKGLRIIDHAAFSQLKDVRVLIRAHGEPPETYRIAKENNITLIDTTCRIVRKLQQRIREDYADSALEGAQVVIAGRKDHPEVKGLRGQIPGSVFIISSEDELEGVDFRKPVLIYAQTTFNIAHFESIRRRALDISQSIPEKERGPLQIHDSVCGQVRRREKALAEFSRKHRVIVFISDPSSSNGKFLFGICRANNPSSHFITGPGDLRPDWFSDTPSVGVTGATSTPLWLLRKVADEITEVVSSQQD